ncbi:YggS family pyridoxal phosphate enzyme [Mangrovactinospora gilvigrisea]|uniref:Pyridoxal phosphate homeostasis protein n=1 Tax=Mangrovactinospora gilvigrisea TaxID=1428644 RepID=A0A1J7C9H0_9ACTN|nr:YggS family pyridoxal phosphate-dependent enzyme [Mangrovactinospora gilvigrisea]OIV38172.1 YggS family pyridoxal phosphate enzyme [Mangrovactinospora gilvigrisea]
MKENLAAVERRVAAACAAAGRPREDVRLIVVTKTYPASDVRLLHGLGVRDVGENRDQDAAPKAEACADLTDLDWHFIGQLQTNKVRSVMKYANRVHSVDRLRLVQALSKEAVRIGRDQPGRELGCLIQVDLEGDDQAPGNPSHQGRGGAHPGDVPAVADALNSAPGLRVDGVMAVAPLAGRYAGDPRAAFARLAEISSSVRRAHPAATMVSAGMSSDLEEAVAEGATHIRVGTAVLGVRSPLR